MSKVLRKRGSVRAPWFWWRLFAWKSQEGFRVLARLEIPYFFNRLASETIQAMAKRASVASTSQTMSG